MKTAKPITHEQAVVRLETLCSRAEHSVKELREKLYRWGITGEEAAAILDDLRKRRFVDDERFARAYINDKYKFARWGRRKIVAGLITKGIMRAIYLPALDEIDPETYKNNLSDLLKAKGRSVEEPRTYDGRTKLFRFGVSRGYETELVARLVRILFT